MKRLSKQVALRLVVLPSFVLFCATTFAESMTDGPQPLTKVTFVDDETPVPGSPDKTEGQMIAFLPPADLAAWKELLSVTSFAAPNGAFDLSLENNGYVRFIYDRWNKNPEFQFSDPVLRNDRYVLRGFVIGDTAKRVFESLSPKLDKIIPYQGPAGVDGKQALTLKSRRIDTKDSSLRILAQEAIGGRLFFPNLKGGPLLESDYLVLVEMNFDEFIIRLDLPSGKVDHLTNFKESMESYEKTLALALAPARGRATRTPTANDLFRIWAKNQPTTRNPNQMLKSVNAKKFFDAFVLQPGALDKLMGLANPSQLDVHNLLQAEISGAFQQLLPGK